jgi:hypothetical protein
VIVLLVKKITKSQPPFAEGFSPCSQNLDSSTQYGGSCPLGLNLPSEQEISATFDPPLQKKEKWIM